MNKQESMYGLTQIIKAMDQSRLLNTGHRLTESDIDLIRAGWIAALAFKPAESPNNKKPEDRTSCAQESGLQTDTQQR